MSTKRAFSKRLLNNFRALALKHQVNDVKVKWKARQLTKAKLKVLADYGEAMKSALASEGETIIGALEEESKLAKQAVAATAAKETEQEAVAAAATEETDGLDGLIKAMNDAAKVVSSRSRHPVCRAVMSVHDHEPLECNQLGMSPLGVLLRVMILRTVHDANCQKPVCSVCGLVQQNCNRSRCVGYWQEEPVTQLAIAIDSSSAEAAEAARAAKAARAARATQLTVSAAAVAEAEKAAATAVAFCSPVLPRAQSCSCTPSAPSSPLVTLSALSATELLSP